MGLFQKMHRFQTDKTEISNIKNFKILSGKVIKHPFVYLVPKFASLITTANVSKNKKISTTFIKMSVQLP